MVQRKGRGRGKRVHAVPFDWTDERIERLGNLWASGVSAAAIAATLGPGCTRNAVIGKAHRLHLTFGGGGRGPAKGPAKIRRSISPKADVAAHATRPALPRKPRKIPPSHQGRGQGRPAKPAEPFPLIEALVPLPDVPPPVSDFPKRPERPTLMELLPDACRWPIGDPGEADFHFCGKLIDYRSYCAKHAGVAFVNYIPPEARPSRRRAA